MRRKLLVSLSLAVVVGGAACNDQSTDPSSSAESTTVPQSAVAVARLRLDPSRLPSSALLRDRSFPDADRVIDPDDYKCRDNTRISNWFNSQVNRIRNRTLDRLLELGALDLAFVDALILESQDIPQEFGYKGEYNRILQSTNTSVKAFWQLTSPDIEVVAMKGSILVEANRVAFLYQFFQEEDGSPVTPENARLYAAEVRELVLKTKSLSDGDHPLFSFNAFATAALPGLWADKIAMGDGMLEGYKAVGLDDVAPQAVYAHEFGHHIQFVNDYIRDDGTTEPIPGQNAETSAAELTRYTELMADVFSAYYLTHQRGGKKEKKRVKEFLQVFFNIGDCAFADPNHHGTPNQRMAAADFAIDVAAANPGTILTEQQLHALFREKYLDLIAPDRK